jgi:hypothetical protein
MDLTSPYHLIRSPRPVHNGPELLFRSKSPPSRTRPSSWVYRSQTPTTGATPHPIQRLPLHIAPLSFTGPTVLYHTIPYHTVRYPYTQPELPSKSAVSSVGLGYPIRHRGSGAGARLTSRGAGWFSYAPRSPHHLFIPPNFNCDNTATRQDPRKKSHQRSLGIGRKYAVRSQGA